MYIFYHRTLGSPFFFFVYSAMIELPTVETYKLKPKKTSLKIT